MSNTLDLAMRISKLTMVDQLRLAVELLERGDLKNAQALAQRVSDLLTVKLGLTGVALEEQLS